MKMILLFCVLLSIGACSGNEEQLHNEGLETTAWITGSDTRVCGCCGGWIIEFDSNVYRFFVLPEDNNFSFNEIEAEDYPLKVKINWAPSISLCGDEITLSKIRLQTE